MKETFITIPGAPSFALLGDFHNGDPAPALRSLSRHKPSFICIAGDLVKAHGPSEGLLVKAQRNVLPFLRGCADIALTFVSLGNQDAVLRDEDLAAIRETGVSLRISRYSVILMTSSYSICIILMHGRIIRENFLAQHSPEQWLIFCRNGGST